MQDGLSSKIFQSGCSQPCDGDKQWCLMWMKFSQVQTLESKILQLKQKLQRALGTQYVLGHAWRSKVYKVCLKNSEYIKLISVEFSCVKHRVKSWREAINPGMLHILCFLFRLWMCSHFYICLMSRKMRPRFTRGVQAIQNLTSFGNSNFWVFGSSKQCSTFYTETSFDRHWQITHLLTWKNPQNHKTWILLVAGNAEGESW